MSSRTLERLLQAHFEVSSVDALTCAPSPLAGLETGLAARLTSFLAALDASLLELEAADAPIVANLGRALSCLGELYRNRRARTAPAAPRGDCCARSPNAHQRWSSSSDQTRERLDLTMHNAQSAVGLGSRHQLDLPR